MVNFSIGKENEFSFCYILARGRKLFDCSFCEIKSFENWAFLLVFLTYFSVSCLSFCTQAFKLLEVCPALFEDSPNLLIFSISYPSQSLSINFPFEKKFEKRPVLISFLVPLSSFILDVMQSRVHILQFFWITSVGLVFVFYGWVPVTKKELFVKFLSGKNLITEQFSALWNFCCQVWLHVFKDRPKKGPHSLLAKQEDSVLLSAKLWFLSRSSATKSDNLNFSQ